MCQINIKVLADLDRVRHVFSIDIQVLADLRKIAPRIGTGPVPTVARASPDTVARGPSRLYPRDAGLPASPTLPPRTSDGAGQARTLRYLELFPVFHLMRKPLQVRRNREMRSYSPLGGDLPKIAFAIAEIELVLSERLVFTDKYPL